METETWRYDRLAEISAKMREGYRSLGLNVGHTETPIIPLIIGDDMKTLLMWRALFDAGIYVNPVIPPAVPPNMSLLRTSYMATHSDEQLDRVLETVATVAKQVG
jgi:7-keto-8-aminopelargonate synthetase-like enzyme